MGIWSWTTTSCPSERSSADGGAAAALVVVVVRGLVELVEAEAEGGEGAEAMTLAMERVDWRTGRR